jgi:hypothetical protein
MPHVKKAELIERIVYMEYLAWITGEQRLVLMELALGSEKLGELTGTAKFTKVKS